MVRPALQGPRLVGSKGKLRTYIRPLIEALLPLALMEFAHSCPHHFSGLY